MSARLLVISQDNTAAQICAIAEAEGWTARAAELGSGCLNAAQRFRPDLIILDARPSSPSFAELCRCIRSIDEIAAATLVTLVGSSQADYGSLLEAGADECWFERADAREFRIRLGAVHRRCRSRSSSSVIRCGEVELDLDRYTVRCSGPPAQLTSSQLRVLKYLMDNAGTYVPHNVLLERAWGRCDLDIGAIRACVKRLRNALAATGAMNVIRSVKGGYLFDTEPAPVRAG